jgi:hypothetical protein
MRLTRPAIVTGAITIAVIHTWAYLSVFGYAFAIGDSGQQVPASLGILVNVLGAPLMFLLYLGPGVCGLWGRWWGDDSNLIIGLACLNGLLWGALLMWAALWLSRRHRHAA